MVGSIVCALRFVVVELIGRLIVGIVVVVVTVVGYGTAVEFVW